ncbi:MAG: lysophospholipid acyltransferase family protein, partial [Sphingobacterium sp.]
MDKLKQHLRYLLYRIVYAGLYLISLLPMSFLYALAYFAYFLTYYLVGYRKEVVIQNIARSFPEKRYGEIRAIVKKFYSC